jgi:C4-dicarboxylate transporter DctM subunit
MAVSRIADALDRALGWFLHAALAAMFATALLQVVTRYVFGSPFAWTEEITRLILIVYVLVGSATAVREDRHPRMDDLVARLPARPQAAVRVIADAVVILCTTALAVHGLGVAERTVSLASAFDIPIKLLFHALAASSVLVAAYQWAWVARRRGRGAATLGLLLGIAAYVAMATLHPPALAGASGSVVVVVALLIFLAIGVPVAFALVAASLVGLWADPIVTFEMLPQRIVGGIDSFLLIAIPFFLTAGEIMNRSGVTGHIVAIARSLVGHLRGGLGQTNVVTNMLLGGVSGSSSADCAAVGKLLIPAMSARGYGAPFAAATTASGSILANMLPPSINLLIYGSLASVSIGALFVATIIPGLLIVAALMVVVWLHARRHAIPREQERFSLAGFGRALRTGAWAMGLPAIIVIGLRQGIFTATEAAAVAAAYAAIIATLVYRGLRWRDLPLLSRAVAEDTSVILLIIAASAPFAWMLTVQQVPQDVAAAMGPLVETPWLLLLAVNLLLLIVGLPLEPAPAMVILVPILLPILQIAGIDPVHFGIIMVFNLFIGALTPPIGNLAFIAAMVAKVPPSAVFRALWPFFAALIAALLAITFVPALSLWLPHALRH